MFNGDVGAMRALSDCAARVQALGGERGFSVSLTEYVHRDFSLVDITAPEATKGHALLARRAARPRPATR